MTWPSPYGLTESHKVQVSAHIDRFYDNKSITTQTRHQGCHASDVAPALRSSRRGVHVSLLRA